MEQRLKIALFPDFVFIRLELAKIIDMSDKCIDIVVRTSAGEKYVHEMRM